MPDQAYSLSPTQVDLLTQLVRRRIGIVLQPYQLDDLPKIVQGACVRFGYRAAAAYLQHLDEGAVNSPELEYLVARITIGESYFFRDDEQLRFLRQAWLPELIERKFRSGDRSLRVWSAGCSAGQEIYTITILLDELLPEPQSWTVHLLGTDINTDALSVAIRGQYTTWSMRTTDADLRSRYFEQLGDAFRIRPELRERVKFSYLNLAEDHFPTMLSGTAAMDLILCRNVFIYFDPAVIPQVMQKFHDSLLPGGYLMLGASDLMAEANSGLELHQWGDTFCFRRRAAFAAPVPPPRPAPTVAAAAPPRVAGAVTAAPPRPVAVAPPRPAPAPPPARSSRYPEVIQLLRAERWDAVVAKVDAVAARDGMDAELAQHKAKALANLGMMEEAAQESETSLAMAPLDKHTYLITALIMMELGNLERAQEALRKALFLDPNFVEAHFQNGLLQLRLGERKGGLRSLKNALELAERLDPQHQVHNAPGLVFGRLAEILRKELHVYEGE